MGGGARWADRFPVPRLGQPSPVLPQQQLSCALDTGERTAARGDQVSSAGWRGAEGELDRSRPEIKLTQVWQQVQSFPSKSSDFNSISME